MPSSPLLSLRLAVSLSPVCLSMDAAEMRWQSMAQGAPDKQRFLATAQQSPGQAGFHETVLKRMIRAPGEEFAPAEPKALAKIATLSPTEATHLLPHAARWLGV